MWSEATESSRSKSGGGTAGRSAGEPGMSTPTKSPTRRVPELLVEDRLVVLRMPRQLHERELVAAAEVDPLAVAAGEDPLGGDREHPPVEGVEELTVDPAGAVDEPGGVGEVGRPLLVDDDRRRGEVGGEVADRSGVVEVGRG